MNQKCVQSSPVSALACPPAMNARLVDLALRESFCPLEQHVLKEVRQPRLARRLVERADRIEKRSQTTMGTCLHGRTRARRPLSRSALEYRQIADPGSQGAGLESSSHVRAAPR